MKAKHKCTCEVCNKAVAQNANVMRVRAFIEQHEANTHEEQECFERELNFASVTRWKVEGRATYVWYYIYNNEQGQKVAWYDNIKNCGYKKGSNS